jgi:hypothetical protein
MGPYYKHRVRSKPASLLGWLAYGVAAFAVGVGLSYCTIQVLETVAKIAG